MYKVFVQDKPLFFICNEFELKNFKHTYTYQEALADAASIVQRTAAGETIGIQGVSNFQEVISFFEGYQPIEAAGGIVRFEDHHLFIKRFGLWDLPKGKIEAGESPDLACLREIEEECGITGLSIVGSLAPTYHVFEGYGSKWLKKTHWFSLESQEKSQLSPQTAEDITEATWLQRSDAQSIENTYNSIKDVLSEYFNEVYK